MTLLEYSAVVAFCSVGTLLAILWGTGRLDRKQSRDVDPFTAEEMADFHREVDAWREAKS